MLLDELFDRAIDRRTLVRATTALAATAATSAFAGPAAYAARRLPDDPFTLGVASGDPRPYGVVLWTRLAPDPQAADGGMPDRPVNVDWQVATDPEMRRVVRSGTVRAERELAHSVHVEVTGLAPGQRYYYRFRAAGELSPVGRTRTALEPCKPHPALSFAFVSCQRITETGRYAAYNALAGEDLDLVVHLGDYIYEERSAHDITDYRQLHAAYKKSPDLRAAHAAMPFVLTFDDHEVRDNYAGEHTKDSDGKKDFLRRRAAAYRAYYEHLPLPVGALPRGPRIRIHRRLTFGDLLTFHVLDTRQYRDGRPHDEKDDGPFAPASKAVRARDRSMLGKDQTEWLKSGLKESRTRWNVLAQQAMMARYDCGSDDSELYCLDGWDGYPAARKRLLRFLRDERVSNPVVITGDMHANFVADLKTSSSAPEPVASELVGTSISSEPRYLADLDRSQDQNPHVKYHNGDRRGYVRCDVNNDLWVASLREVRDPAATKGRARTQAVFALRDRQRHTERLT